MSTALVRAVAHPAIELPPWPDLTEPRPELVTSWVSWLRQVWAIDAVAEAVTLSSPVLAEQVSKLCAEESPSVREARRTVHAVARYAQRLLGRPTPFGLLAGVAPAVFGSRAPTRWGTAHRAIARAGAGWLTDVIAQFERCPELLSRLSVVANSTLTVRDDRLIVPYQPHPGIDGQLGAVEVSLRHSAPVRAAIDAAHSPIRVEVLASQVRETFPQASAAVVMAMLTQLIAHGALITSLHAPSTEPDALGHLLRQLDEVGAGTVTPIADFMGSLQEVHAGLQRHNSAPPGDAPAARRLVASRMRSLALSAHEPLAVDLRLDASVTLPDQVATEVERAALVLTRLSAYPYGTAAWRAYHQRFYERYGIGSLVPVREVVDPDSGIGLPDGYPGSPAAEPRSPISRRDEVLLSVAQRAALDGTMEVVLDEALIAQLELGPQRLRLPPHLEACVRVQAADEEDLARGRFTLEVTSVSRAAGGLTGRFLSVLRLTDAGRLGAGLTDLPASDRDTVAAQVSFPPLDPGTAHVARAVQVLPTVISLAEHRWPSRAVLTVGDLAVGCDGRRMYLAVPDRGHRIEAVGLHALNLRTHTPPLARFLIELGRAQCAQVTAFDWGTAARAKLPFLPRVRYGRAILAPATWRLEAAELPDQHQPWYAWDDALDEWRARRRLPRLVHLVEADRRLPLDLDESAHRVLLRTHLLTAPRAVLVEAPAPENLGWCGGRPHEVIVALHATEPPPWPPLPTPTPARVIGRDQGQAPASSRILLAKLYGDIRRQDLLLAEHLPRLIAQWDAPPDWWFLRFRDPDQHLRLRIALPDVSAFGPAAERISAWADDLHRRGLLREVQYATSYPETGRWGSGPAMQAAEAVFIADSHSVLTQLRQPVRPSRQALVAAHTAAIAVAFTGSVDAGMRWLVDHVPATAPQPVPRPLFREAVHLAHPGGDWATLRAAAGGTAIVDAWKNRDVALAVYRTHLPGPHTDGIDVDDVLGSLMHAHYIRAVGIDFDDEDQCRYLARAAALAYFARSRS
ncbi:thiopeptide-type bacteriocin biosynthesis domain-containing protein [Micromonospora purpureochromogenes]|uniref:Thiopeptide-type bacteriocin biosynthesis domain-containing protein n=1 Tax=Micromonospora purpureochromogenes TaxID=47872 RepID=A0A1C4Z793_9ACTN|nr:lantibiotic dehydratase [Micromonospora purpureochromogenes]SCF28872.1 thiopeptide-type bacteriocin biosynthesis domain-containing protein [Micromonospora purpureochromogenes]